MFGIISTIISGLRDGWNEPYDLSTSTSVPPHRQELLDSAISVGQLLRGGRGSQPWREGLWPVSVIGSRRAVPAGGATGTGLTRYVFDPVTRASVRYDGALAGWFEDQAVIGRLSAEMLDHDAERVVGFIDVEDAYRLAMLGEGLDEALIRRVQQTVFDAVDNND